MITVFEICSKVGAVGNTKYMAESVKLRKKIWVCACNLKSWVVSSPGFLMFSTNTRKEEEPGIRSHMTNIGMMSWKRGSQRLSILNWSTNFSLSNTALWGHKGSNYTPLKALAHHISHPHWTGAFENKACPHSIITTHLPLYMGWCLSCESGSQGPPLSRVHWKYQGVWGRG